MSKYTLSQGRPYPLGAYLTDSGIQFAAAHPRGSRLSLRLCDKSGRAVLNINMNEYAVNGCISSVMVHGLDHNEISYSYTLDGELYRDPYTMRLRSKRRWGDHRNRLKNETGRIYSEDYDWEGDKPLRLSYSDVIGYMLHVRGFTRHSSSQVNGKGTFRGIIEKIPYLKELGITQVELMPAYDFDECDRIVDYRSGNLDENGRAEGSQYRINYWGFKEGSYFVPKPQYSYSDDSVIEFKDMVKALHKAGIEIVMQFYFPLEINRNLIGNCLQFWQSQYHVDGFHIFGSHIPLDIIATDPMLTDCKIYYERYDADGIYSTSSPQFVNGNLAEYNQDYQVDIRRFLKSDEDMLHKFMFRQRCNPDRIKVIDHITSYDGFTLNDLVSYDHKHNEENGEDNKDGTGYNYSWNCGSEGSTRKNAILKLRMKQLKNAFCMLMFSQSAPMFMAGDEFLNSQAGNNNAYCQDNEVTWLNWRRNKRNTEFYEFVRKLIAIRKEHKILHLEREAAMLDSRSCGYPDISYHSEMAWYPQMDTHIRHVGTMLCGEYAEGKADDYFYIATNMHWEDHEFALPKLPKDREWVYLLDTAGREDKAYPFRADENGNMKVTVPERTILVLTGIVKKKKKNKNKN